MQASSYSRPARQDSKKKAPIAGWAPLMRFKSERWQGSTAGGRRPPFGASVATEASVAAEASAAVVAVPVVALVALLAAITPLLAAIAELLAAIAALVPRGLAA